MNFLSDVCSVNDKPGNKGFSTYSFFYFNTFNSYVCIEYEFCNVAKY